MTATTYYAVQIATGTGRYRFLGGWDATYATRADAEACAERAKRVEGWSARVVSATADEARRMGWLDRPVAKGGAA